jgi:hypothetical protein
VYLLMDVSLPTAWAKREPMSRTANPIVLLFLGVGLGSGLRVKCPARVRIAPQYSLVAVARNEVRLMEFTKWLERVGGSPRETSDRHRIRSILGMPTSQAKQAAR